MAYIPRPLDTSPSTTMTIRQGGDLINDNFEAILDDLNFTNMPTVGGDPIVESGSNSDGEWTRWADGTQICRARKLGTGSGDRTVPYPAPFSSSAYSVSLQEVKGNSSSTGATFAFQVNESSATQLAFNTNPGSASTSDVGYTAVGR